MKYFITAKWWRECHFYPWKRQNFTIEENPEVWLQRQKERLTEQDEWTDIIIESCCNVDDDTVVSSEPDFSKR